IIDECRNKEAPISRGRNHRSGSDLARTAGMQGVPAMTVQGKSSGDAMFLVATTLLVGCLTPPDAARTGPAEAAFTWSRRAPLPVPGAERGSAAVRGKIYVIGGYSGSGLARVDEYDPATNRWTRKTDMPTARRSPVVGVINDRIFVAAGMQWTDPNNVTY